MEDRHLMQKVVEKIKYFVDAQFQLINLEQVYGGDINKTWKLHGNNANYFLKVNKGKPDDFFAKEKSGLDVLKKANHSLYIPQAYFSGVEGDEQYLLMEYLQFENPQNGFAEKLGRGLAELHQNHSDFFGLKENNYLGSQPQDNTEKKDWATFYAENRILPQARRAIDNGYFNNSDMKATEQLCKSFSNIFPDEKPSLLHGDLWNGNYACLIDQNTSIFDPAIYYGNREIDIALTLLFGGFDRAFYQTYNEVFPLEKGWQTRIGICQLYPLLMHLNHFGMGYYSRVKEIIG